MSHFRYRVQQPPTSIVHEKNITLDATHKKNISVYKKEKNNIKNYKEELTELKIEFNELDKRKRHTLSNDELDRFFILKKEIKKNNENIEKINSNDEFNNYYINTNKILYTYFDSVDSNKKHAVDSKKNKKPKVNQSNFFKRYEETDEEEPVKKVTNYDIGGIFEDEEDETELQRGELHEQFMGIVNKQYFVPIKTRIVDEYPCQICRVDMRIIQNEAMIVCDDCGYMEPILIDSNKPSYKDPPPEISYFAYIILCALKSIQLQLCGYIGNNLVSSPHIINV
jgi:DNA-directed RNA polymerase subunit RPC12/RpoP